MTVPQAVGAGTTAPSLTRTRREGLDSGAWQRAKDLGATSRVLEQDEVSEEK